MAGNKALQKYKESKIPKKGKGKVIVEIPIYKEPNTHSTIIGRIKKNQEITWISKSICDDREWIRCNKNNNYGYIVGYENSDKCNLDIGTIKEDKTEPKKEYGVETKEEIKPITKEEIELGNEALKEILNDDYEEWNKNDKDENNESKTDNSTETDENNKSEIFELNNEENKILRLNEEELSEYYFGDDISKIDIIKKENDRLMNEIKCKLGKNSKDTKNQKKEEKNNNKNDNSYDDEPFSEYVEEIIESMDKNKRDEYKIVDKILKDPRTVDYAKTIHEKSQAKKEENLKEEKNKKKVEGKKKKKAEKEKKHIIINGEIVPINDCEILGNREEVLKMVKKALGIPEDAKPIRIETNKNKAEKYNTGKVYVYEVLVDGKKEERIIRDDNRGHLQENGYYIPPHFNDEKGGHYYYLWNEEGDDL